MEIRFKTGGYCPACLHATSGCTCMTKGIDLLEDCDEVKDIKHLTEERDDAVEHLKDIIQMNFSDEVAQKQLNHIITLNKRLKLLEDQLIVGRVTKANNE